MKIQDQSRHLLLIQCKEFEN